MAEPLVGMQADDLTGACDSGAPFAARGLLTLVLLPGIAIPPPAPAVLVLDTESRDLPAPEAGERARAAAAGLAPSRPAVLYKKLDSTLRGQVAAEVAGMLDGAGVAEALVAPAFPAQGRTVVDGMLLIDGRLADEDPMAPSPGRPSTGASVLALFAHAGQRPVGALPLETVRDGAGSLASRLARWTGCGGRILVADAESDADLAALVGAAANRPALLAGSAGLAGALAARLAPAAEPRAVRLEGPLLVVAGSANPVTAVQVTALAARGIAGVRVDDPGGPLRPLAAPAPDPAGAAWAIVAAPPPDPVEPVRRRAMAARLAALAAERVARSRPGTLVLTGGETAVAVCRALGASGLRLLGEVERGLAAAALLDGPHAGLVVVTKAGGFGDPGALARLLEACG